MHLDLLSIPQSGGKNVKTFRLFLTFSVLVANLKKLLNTMANPARGLLNREKRTKRESLTAYPPPQIYIESIQKKTYTTQCQKNYGACKCHGEVLYLQLVIPPKRFDMFSPDWGMLRRSRCVGSDFSLRYSRGYDMTCDN